MAKYHLAKKLQKEAGPVIELTEKEMIQAFINIGMSKKDAQMQVNIEKVMLSEVLIGNKMFRLKK